MFSKERTAIQFSYYKEPSIVDDIDLSTIDEIDVFWLLPWLDDTTVVIEYLDVQAR